MHPHKFISHTKKGISFCNKCSKLFYKGNISKELPLKIPNKFYINPLKMKYRPFSVVANYNLDNNIKYLESKIIGISKVKELVKKYGLNSMVYFKSINFINQIFLENNFGIENINDIASICVLLVVLFNDRCLPLVAEEVISKDENDILYHYHNFQEKDINNELLSKEQMKHKTNINGLFHYVRKNVNNYKYLEVLCLKHLNYDLEKYSAYDYLILFFDLGIFFCKENININILELLKYCIHILDFITDDKRSCDYSQYTLAMSILKVALENNVFFDKDVFKYIYGVDLSKKKYINCSKFVKNILNLYNNNINTKNILYNNQFIINQELFINKYLENLIKNIPNNGKANNTLNKNENKNKSKKGKNNLMNNNIISTNQSNLNIYPFIINNSNSNSIIINNNFINNNININNNNFYYQNCIINNFFNSINNNKIRFNNNNNYPINIKDLKNSQKRNYNIFENN